MRLTHLRADHVSIAQCKKNLLSAGWYQERNRNQDKWHDTAPGRAEFINPDLLESPFSSLFYLSWLAPMSVQPVGRINNGIGLAVDAGFSAFGTSNIRERRVFESFGPDLKSFNTNAA